MKPGKNTAMLQGCQYKPAKQIFYTDNISYSSIWMDRYLQTENNFSFCRILGHSHHRAPLSHVFLHPHLTCLLSTIFPALNQAQANYFPMSWFYLSLPHAQMMRCSDGWANQGKVSVSSSAGGSHLLANKPTFLCHFFTLCSNYSPFFPFCQPIPLFLSLLHTIHYFSGFFPFFNRPITTTVFKRKLRLLNVSHLSFQHYD